MLDELNAIAFEYQITFESRTHPWIILTKKVGHPLESYVVKLFTKNEVEKNYAVAKEVFTNIIAREFELSVPKAALINLNTSDFVASLPDNLAREIHLKDYRIKFGSQYIEGTLSYNDSAPNRVVPQFEI